jgi:hypothetical protein
MYSATAMLEKILQFDHRAVSLTEKLLGFLGDSFAITWRGVAEVLLGIMLICGISWAWQDRSPVQILLFLLAGFGIKSLVVAGRTRACILFRSTAASLARTLMLPFALSHVAYFVHHSAAFDDRLVAVADWSALLLFYLLATGESGERSRKRAMSWDRIKALFGTRWVVTPAPAEE